MRYGAFSVLLAAMFGVALAVAVVAATSRAQSIGAGGQFLSAYEQGTDVDVPVSAARSLLASVQEAAPLWVASDPARTRVRRQVSALAILEVAARLTQMSPVQVSRELEAACELLRQGERGEFERLWLVAASSLMVGSTNHLKHARALFPSDPHLQLADILARPEASTVANIPKVDKQRLSGASGHGQTGVPRPMHLDQTTKELQALRVDPEVGPEASARLGLLEFLMGQVQASLLDFESAAELSDDRYIRNLSWLMRGLALASQGETERAANSYRAAVNALPTITAGTAFAVQLFLSGERLEAAEVLRSVYSQTPPVLDPWHDPVGLRRHLGDDIRTLRASLGLPPRQFVDLLQWRDVRVDGTTVPTTVEAKTPVQDRGSQAMFRAGTRSVMVDVAVYDHKTPVRGLTAGDFEIFDNGVRQQIEASDLTEVPLDITIVLEMNDPVIGGLDSVWQPEDALQDVVRLSSLLRPVDRLRVFMAGLDGPREALSLQSATTVDLRRARISPLATSALTTSTVFDATAAALIAGIPPERRALVVIFTDGIDGSSILTADQLLAVAKQSEAVAYLSHRRIPRRPRIGETSPTAENVLLRFMLRPISPTAIDDVVEATGGSVAYTTPGDPAAKFFDQVLASFRERYVFHYTLTGVAEPGWHSISVSLKTPKQFRVVARKGYAVDR